MAIISNTLMWPQQGSNGYIGFIYVGNKKIRYNIEKLSSVFFIKKYTQKILNSSIFFFFFFAIVLGGLGLSQVLPLYTSRTATTEW